MSPFSFFFIPSRALVRLALILSIALTAAAASAQSMIHIEPTQGSLQNAINSVSSGGVIELETGTYSSPPGGWSIISGANDLRGFIIRAANGASPVLDGGGSSQILTSVVPQPVTFWGLIFAN